MKSIKNKFFEYFCLGLNRNINKKAKSEMTYLVKMLLWAAFAAILMIAVGYLVYAIGWRQ